MKREQLVLGNYYYVWLEWTKEYLPARYIYEGEKTPLFEFIPTIEVGHDGKICGAFHKYKHLLKKRNNCRWVNIKHVQKEMKIEDLIWVLL